MDSEQGNSICKALLHMTQQVISPINIFNRVAFCDSIVASQRSFPKDSKFWFKAGSKSLPLRNEAFYREDTFYCFCSSLQ